jgi:hypothetical protein
MNSQNFGFGIAELRSGCDYLEGPGFSLLAKGSQLADTSYSSHALFTQVPRRRILQSCAKNCKMLGV